MISAEIEDFDTFDRRKKAAFSEKAFYPVEIANEAL